MSKITVRGLSQSLTVTQGPVIIGNSGAITAADITDSSATGRAVLTGNVVAGRTALDVYSTYETYLQVQSGLSTVLTPALKAIDAKPSCKVATTGNLASFYVNSIDGVSVSEGERVFVWQQTNPIENGTYQHGNGTLRRFPQSGGSKDEFTAFAHVEIEQGTYAGRKFRLTTQGNIVVGTTPMTWELVGRESLGLGSASLLDVAASGDATAGQVVKWDDSTLTNDRTASGLRTATTVVSVSAATAPSAGQTLVATSSTAATWQTPAGGISIGDSIGGGTAKSIPFIDASGNLAQDPTFNYNAISNALVVQNVGANIVNAGTVAGGSFVFAQEQDTRFIRFAPQRIGSGGPPNFNDAVLEIGAVRKKPYTVGTVPLSRVVGDVFEVVDALAPVVFSPVVAGGSVTTDVRWDGTNLIVKG